MGHDRLRDMGRAGSAWRPRTTWPGAASLVFLLACGAGDSSGEGGAPSESDEEAGAGMGAETASEVGGGELAIDPAMLPDGVTADMVRQGKELFEGGGICYTCHMQDGKGGPLAPDLTDSAWLNVDGEYASIVELVKEGVAQPLEHPGVMLPRAGMALTDDQVAAVAAYAYMLSRF